ncbi:hypothetical protein FVE85_0022 [Porphyridium purpureum]|uniref:Uncharacterized protein n=1 Tax=Porphyridium purpureum TaxID=35688 RepID=A0A5J4Z0E3_PORPP|nr:hypothetical protein FVE85_0022 [Porphyridium purpureum]|eukprot:POR3115..scf208_2
MTFHLFVQVVHTLATQDVLLLNEHFLPAYLQCDFDQVPYDLMKVRHRRRREYDACLMPSGSTGSFGVQSLIASTGSVRDGIQADEFVTRGGMLLGRFVDVRARDEPQVEAVTVVQLRRPDNKLENVQI